MLIGKPDKNAYTASHPNYGTVDMTTGIEAEESEGGMSRRLKKLIGPRYYTLRIRLGLPGKMDRPTPATGKTVTVCVLLLFIVIFVFCSFIIFGEITLTEFTHQLTVQFNCNLNEFLLAFFLDFPPSRSEQYRGGSLVGFAATNLPHHLHCPAHHHHPPAT